MKLSERVDEIPTFDRFFKSDPFSDEFDLGSVQKIFQ